jgi:hypothetical protein
MTFIGSRRGASLSCLAVALAVGCGGESSKGDADQNAEGGQADQGQGGEPGGGDSSLGEGGAVTSPRGGAAGLAGKAEDGVGGDAVGGKPSRGGAGSGGATGGAGSAGGSGRGGAGGGQTVGGGSGHGGATGGAHSSGGSSVGGESGGSMSEGGSGGMQAEGGSGAVPTSGGTTGLGGSVASGGTAGSDQGGEAGGGGEGAAPTGGAGGAGGQGCRLSPTRDDDCVDAGYGYALFCDGPGQPAWGCVVVNSIDSGDVYCCSPTPETGMDSARCQDILLDNSGVMQTYPGHYTAAEDAVAEYEAEEARLLSTYGLSDSDYSFLTDGITPSLELRHNSPGEWLPISETPADASLTAPLITSFLSQWPVIFHAEGLLTDEGTGGCSAAAGCRYEFTQDYCGLRVASPNAMYGGTVRVDLDSEVGGVLRIFSQLVPMVPLPRNALVTEQAMVDSIVGAALSWSCADGIHTSVVSAEDPLSFPDAPTVYVRPSPLEPEVLEYRLAVGVGVTADSGTWTAWVDALDGSLLDIFAEFICD